MSRDPISRNNVTLLGNPEAGTTLLFVHGLGSDQSVWSQLTPAFLDGYRLVLFDNVGAVESNQADFREDQYRYLNVGGYAADILEICAALKLSGNIILIGHSLGALAGLIASVRSPRQFGALVLLGMSPRYTNTGEYEGGFTKAEIDKAYEALMSDYSAWTRAVAQAAMGNPDQPQLASRFADSMSRVPREMMLTVLCSVLQTDERDLLPQVPVPVSLIQSHDDYFVPLAVARYLQAHIPDCRLTLIDASGHLPHVSAPEKVVEVIRSILGARQESALPAGS
ncbi:alpha/beta hydrolase [Zoogloea sp.]|uniref:alpha/beta fold hydrolase n=1 Tax=Zoogloea sp. TaxID=49181 RepID=UPI0031FBB52A